MIDDFWRWFDAHEWPMVLLAAMGVAGTAYFIVASLWDRFQTWRKR